MTVLHEEGVVCEGDRCIDAHADKQPNDLAFPLAAADEGLRAIYKEDADAGEQEHAGRVDQVDPWMVMLVGGREQGVGRNCEV